MNIRKIQKIQSICSSADSDTDLETNDSNSIIKENEFIEYNESKILKIVNRRNQQPKHIESALFLRQEGVQDSTDRINEITENKLDKESAIEKLESDLGYVMNNSTSINDDVIPVKKSNPHRSKFMRNRNNGKSDLLIVEDVDKKDDEV